MVSAGEKYPRERDIPFEEINVNRDPDAARDLVGKTGQTGVPMLGIGSNRLVGLGRPEIEKELLARGFL